MTILSLCQHWQVTASTRFWRKPVLVSVLAFFKSSGSMMTDGKLYRLMTKCYVAVGSKYFLQPTSMVCIAHKHKSKCRLKRFADCSDCRARCSVFQVVSCACSRIIYGIVMAMTCSKSCHILTNMWSVALKHTCTASTYNSACACRLQKAQNEQSQRHLSSVSRRIAIDSKPPPNMTIQSKAHSYARLHEQFVQTWHRFSKFCK